VSKPFAASKLDDGAAVAFNMRTVNTGLWYKVLSLDLSLALLARTVQMIFRALSGNMAFYAASRMYCIAILVWTSDLDVVAHVDN
jgi:hypothetical protein